MSGYIGTQPVPQATQTRDAFTATSGQTSFATGGYTPTFLDVFLNGVKLAAADYTASNGSDVVLATGATTGDILEVVAYTNFDTANVTGAANFTVTGSFTSQGIDDNANATAITIDSSEHVLVGTTDSAVWNDTTGTGGINLRSDGILAAARNGGEPLLLNRLGTDGELIKFNKNGTTVGSIGVDGSSPYFATAIGSTLVGVKMQGGSTPRINPTDGNGDSTDGVATIGFSSSRFKDLYLSGGVFLGGTGAANKLDDYEFGSFTPTVSDTNGNLTPTYVTAYTFGRYTKIGQLVTFELEVRTSGTSGSKNGYLRLGGLPFNSASNPSQPSFIFSLYNIAFNTSYLYTAEFLGGGSNTLYIRESRSNTINSQMVSSAWSGNNPTLIRISGSYRTAS